MTATSTPPDAGRQADILRQSPGPRPLAWFEARVVMLPLPLVLGAVLEIKNSGIFYGAAGLVFAYLLYIIIRPRKGARPGSRENEAEL